MVSNSIRPEIGCVGAKLYYKDDTIQHAGVILGVAGLASHSYNKVSRYSNGYFGKLNIPQTYSAVTGDLLVVRKEIFDNVNGLDPNLKSYYNDVDFCLRVRGLGYRNLWIPFTEAYHYKSKIRGSNKNKSKQDDFHKEVNYMENKWGNILVDDPCYSINLTRSYGNFALRSD